MGFFPCLEASIRAKMSNWEVKSPHKTSPSMKKLMKAFQVMCLIIMKKRPNMLISLG
jgi:hypothetical protein